MWALLGRFRCSKCGKLQGICRRSLRSPFRSRIGVCRDCLRLWKRTGHRCGQCWYPIQAMWDLGLLLDREVFAVVTLDAKNRMIGIHTAAVGSLSSSIVLPRDVLKVAVLQSAASIICCHDHPSGDSAPSREDRECTERLAAAAKILGIRLLDHIVFGEEYFSFADAGLIDPA